MDLRGGFLVGLFVGLSEFLIRLNPSIGTVWKGSVTMVWGSEADPLSHWRAHLGTTRNCDVTSKNPARLTSIISTRL
jgi:hypothetical protein